MLPWCTLLIWRVYELLGLHSEKALLSIVQNVGKLIWGLLIVEYILNVRVLGWYVPVFIKLVIVD